MMEPAADFATRPRRRNLVFTSAGDHAGVDRWLRGRREFDLWVTYYGDGEGRYRELGEYYNERKGAKFQNLAFIYEQWPNIIAGYDAVMVLDDDIVINVSAISRLFRIREQYDLWILQPAFSEGGKISHAITKRNPRCRLRFTNFIEMNCPLFRRDKLDAFMAVYDPVLVGWGMDWWYMHVLGRTSPRKFAVIDVVPCVNPTEEAKGISVREICRVQTVEEAKGAWKAFKQRQGIDVNDEVMSECGRVMRSPLFVAACEVAHAAKMMKRKLRNRLKEIGRS